MKCGENPLEAHLIGGGERGCLPGSPLRPWRSGSARCVSDARLVAVEGRDVEHVAVCAHADRLHLPVAGQRGRVGGAAGAEDLEGSGQ